MFGMHQMRGAAVAAALAFAAAPAAAIDSSYSGS